METVIIVRDEAAVKKLQTDVGRVGVILYVFDFKPCHITRFSHLLKDFI